MRTDNDALLRENTKLKDTQAQWRAACSSAAAGNDNINGNFPFKTEIIASYINCVNTAFALLDPCFDDDNMLWACAVSKRIFELCQKFVSSFILAPQSTFKDKVCVGEGDLQESEWESTRIYMTKLQRATLQKVLSDMNGEVKKFADSVEAALLVEEIVLITLTKHKDYKIGSLGNVMLKLMKVNFLVICRSFHLVVFV